MLPGLDTVTAAVGHHNCCHDLRLDTNTHPGIFSPFQTRDGNKNESKDNDPKPKQERKPISIFNYSGIVCSTELLCAWGFIQLLD